MIVICSGAGMRRIVIDADGNPVEQKEQDGAPKDCAACHLAGGCAVAPLSGAAVAAPVYGFVPHPAPVVRIRVSQRQFLRPEGRAPPFSL